MFYIGCHLSSVKGFESMGREAIGIGANTFQFFTRNPRGGRAKNIDEEDVQKFLKLADENGFGKLHAFHINDSLNPAGARKDRHARIGEGHLGLETIANVINHPSLKNLPCILETPNELDGYAKEIELLKSAYTSGQTLSQQNNSHPHP